MSQALRIVDSFFICQIKSNFRRICQLCIRLYTHNYHSTVAILGQEYRLFVIHYKLLDFRIFITQVRNRFYMNHEDAVE